MKKQTITAIIPALNEENNIERCLKSVAWCDKVQVLWMGNDNTGKIAKEIGAEVIHTPSKGQQSNFVAVQENINWAIDHATTDWILRIDADEVVSEELKEEIVTLLNGSIDNNSTKKQFNNKIVAYGIPRKHYIWGGFLKGGDWAYDRLIRLFKPQFARYDPVVHVHEQFKVTGQIDYLKHSLLHYSHPTLKIALHKFDTYTTVEINDLHITKATALFRLLTQPPYIFLRWMIWHHGYKDGVRGIIAGGLRSWYDILLYTKYLKKNA